ncbi:MAG: hypothetical protein RR583_08215 [Enterococcus sp.]
MKLIEYGLLLFLAFRLSMHAFEFKKSSRLELLSIPVYSLIMFLVTMTWTQENLITAIILILVAGWIGWFQASKSEIKVTEELDRYQRPIILIKKGLPYLLGWLAIFILGIVMHGLHHSTITVSAIFSEFGHELLKDISLFSRFNSKDSWYIWAISGVSSMTFTYCLEQKEDRLKEILHQKPKRRQK